MNLLCQTNRFVLWPQFQWPTTPDPAQDRYRFIRSKMILQGVTNKAIADAAEVSREYVFMVLKGERKGYRVRLLVAQKCQLPVQALFPDTPLQYQHREAA